MDYAKMFKAFSDPNRLEIIKYLSKGVCCSCQFIDNFELSQPTMTYHLKMIRDTGLANTRKEGTWMKYELDYDKIDEMIEFLKELKDNRSGGCKC